MKTCRLCNFHGDKELFKKSNRYPDGYSMVCKKCIAWNIYLNKHKNGFVLKECKKHGVLSHENIVIVSRHERGKPQILMRCGLCIAVWHENAINNDSLKNERINSNASIDCKVCKTHMNHSNFTASELKKKNATCNKCWKNYQEKYEENRSISRKFIFKRSEYNKLWNEQNGLCAICLKPETAMENEKPRRLSTDHCHKIQQETGKTVVRGLLCSQCNNGLGRFKDNIDILKNAIKYMERFNERAAKLSEKSCCGMLGSIERK